MAVKEIGGVNRLTPNFRIEIQSARAESPALKYGIHCDRDFRRVVGKLIRIPSELRITTVHVDASKDTERLGERDLVLEAVTGQSCVIGFDINLDFFLQPITAQKSQYGCSIEIVLVLGRFTRFGLDQYRPVESNFALVV